MNEKENLEKQLEENIKEEKEVRDEYQGSEEKNGQTVEENQEENREDSEEGREAEDESEEEILDDNSEIQKLKDSYLRLQADFANYKRRNEKEKQDIYKYASEKLITKLLSVEDNLERALGQGQDDDPVVQGIMLVQKELMDILKSEGLTEIKSDGQPFDANVHHAVFMEESEEYDTEHVIETFQKGYKLNEKVIRPAMVKVAK